jgi:hypothetical protein
MLCALFVGYYVYWTLLPGPYDDPLTWADITTTGRINLTSTNVLAGSLTDNARFRINFTKTAMPISLQVAALTSAGSGPKSPVMTIHLLDEGTYVCTSHHFGTPSLETVLFFQCHEHSCLSMYLCFALHSSQRIGRQHHCRHGEPDPL